VQVLDLNSDLVTLTFNFVQELDLNFDLVTLTFDFVQVLDLNSDLVVGFASWRAVLWELVEMKLFGQACSDLIKTMAFEGRAVSHIALAFLHKQARPYNLRYRMFSLSSFLLGPVEL
jgi:hypothetical protein